MEVRSLICNRTLGGSAPRRFSGLHQAHQRVLSAGDRLELGAEIDRMAARGEAEVVSENVGKSAGIWRS
jgi:hypothetical protein